MRAIAVLLSLCLSGAVQAQAPSDKGRAAPAAGERAAVQP